MKETKIKKIVEFVTKNGWEMIEKYDEYMTFEKKDNICIDISDDEIVLIDDNGDFNHIPLNEQTLYYMLGYFIQNHFIAINYKWISS